MDTIKVKTSHRMFIDGRDTPAGTQVEVKPTGALDIINANRGALVDPDDARKLRKWATAQGMRRDFSGSY